MSSKPAARKSPGHQALAARGAVKVAPSRARSAAQAMETTAPPTAPTMGPLRHRNLPLLLLHARESVIAHFRPILNEHGITEQQWRVLRTLLERGPLEPREIVVASRISSPSLAGMLARMDAQGLVRRERFAQDQRRVRVSATAKSRALAQAIAPRIEATYAELEAHVGAATFAHFYAVLDDLVALLGEPPPDPDGNDVER